MKVWEATELIIFIYSGHLCVSERLVFSLIMYVCVCIRMAKYMSVCIDIYVHTCLAHVFMCGYVRSVSV